MLSGQIQHATKHFFPMGSDHFFFLRWDYFSFPVVSTICIIDFIISFVEKFLYTFPSQLLGYRKCTENRS